MMMAALVCFFGKTTLSNSFLFLYYVFVLFSGFCYLGIIRFLTQCWIRFLRSTAYNLFFFVIYFLQNAFGRLLISTTGGQCPAKDGSNTEMFLQVWVQSRMRRSDFVQVHRLARFFSLFHC